MEELVTAGINEYLSGDPTRWSKDRKGIVYFIISMIYALIFDRIFSSLHQ